jgi:PIN domain nuclease of toxin-antitoxin system
MKLLLDTHAFLWWISDGEQLTRRARTAIADARNECLVSIASCWEIAVKVSLDKLRLGGGPVGRFLPEQLAANGFEVLPVALRHVAMVAELPFHHRDPFDRMLVAQALADDLALVSADPAFAAYGVRLVW